MEKFYIDLNSALYDSAKRHSQPLYSTSESDTDSLSFDEDNPEDEGDRYITVISKRKKKLLKNAARARGPLTL